MSVRRALLIACACTASGCVSFSGPGDLRAQLEDAGHVTLHEQEGVCVGPLGVAFANLVLAPWLPMSLDGVSTVEYAEYIVEAPSGDLDHACLRDLELAGWQPFLRVRDGDAQTLALVEERGPSVRAILFIEQRGHGLEVVCARGNFDTIVENLLSGDLVRGGASESLVSGLRDTERSRR